MKRVIEELSALEPGKLPLEFFNEISRLTVTPVIEIVPFFRDSDGRVKVLLLQRTKEDSMWPGMYHVPGSVVISTEDNLRDAIERTIRNKVTSAKKLSVNFVDVQLVKVKRGTELAIIYVISLSQLPHKSLLFSPSDLPENMIEGHAEFVKAAYKKHISTT